jgi:hypothetical protein
LQILLNPTEEINLKYAPASFMKNLVQRNCRPSNLTDDERFVNGGQEKEYVNGNIIEVL